MCGIAGYVDPGAALDHARTLRRLADALAHRGPDGEGFFEEGPVGFAHRRLAIIDLTNTGDQPLSVGEVVVVFNGEIYNYRELREELRDAGHEFTGTSDTEVLARAYVHWGIEFVERLRGMWAFALFDRRSGNVLCSRDPFGIKPFYYCVYRGAFLFASEPRALLAGGVPSRANLKIIAPYVALGVCDHTTECFFAGIHQLPAGATVLVDRSAHMQAVHSLDPCAARTEGSLSLDQFAHCVEDSVRIHLRSDVPVGTCLSGGLDSSIVAALASRAVREANGSAFAAITAASGDARTDERQYAGAVAEHCKLAWQVVEPGDAEFTAEIDECLRAQGEPALSPSIYLQYRVMQRARAAGVKVMLDGQGGDELLCGYERYVPIFALEILRLQGFWPAAKQYLVLARNSRLGVRGMSTLAAYLLLPLLRQRVIAARIAFMRSSWREQVFELVAQMRPAYHQLGGARLADITRFSLPALLRYEDRNSMAHSIEARVPYVDRQVAACALQLPGEVLLGEGFSKYPLRRLAARILPPAIAWRRAKIGFEAPTQRWLASLDGRLSCISESPLLRRLCREVPKPGEMDAGLQWRLYNLARWESLFAVGSD